MCDGICSTMEQEIHLIPPSAALRDNRRTRLRSRLHWSSGEAGRKLRRGKQANRWKKNQRTQRLLSTDGAD